MPEGKCLLEEDDKKRFLVCSSRTSISEAELCAIRQTFPVTCSRK
jgi:hypothetical protein